MISKLWTNLKVKLRKQFINNGGLFFLARLESENACYPMKVDFIKVVREGIEIEG